MIHTHTYTSTFCKQYLWSLHHPRITPQLPCFLHQGQRSVPWGYDDCGKKPTQKYYHHVWPELILCLCFEYVQNNLNTHLWQFTVCWNQLLRLYLYVVVTSGSCIGRIEPPLICKPSLSPGRYILTCILRSATRSIWLVGQQNCLTLLHFPMWRSVSNTILMLSISRLIQWTWFYGRLVWKRGLTFLRPL